MFLAHNGDTVCDGFKLFVNYLIYTINNVSVKIYSNVKNRYLDYLKYKTDNVESNFRSRYIVDVYLGESPLEFNISDRYSRFF